MSTTLSIQELADRLENLARDLVRNMNSIDSVITATKSLEWEIREIRDELLKKEE